MIEDARQLSDAVNAAKDAVRDLEEPLKTEAFKILLEKLISGENQQKRVKVRSTAGSRLKARANATAAKRTTVQAPSSTLRLGVDELRQLKAYCERFELGGTEQIAFVLANFCREHTNLERVTARDVAYLYRQLVSQKVKGAKVAAVNDPSDWARALTWLAVPSRKKEWLERSGDGYIVSNAGLLRFHELESQASTKSS